MVTKSEIEDLERRMNNAKSFEKISKGILYTGICCLGYAITRGIFFDSDLFSKTAKTVYASMDHIDNISFIIGVLFTYCGTCFNLDDYKNKKKLKQMKEDYKFSRGYD